MPEAQRPTRYERVQAILDRAAEASTADYGGAGRFWNLPIDDFLEAEVFGIRMIAPAGVPRRAAASGLVRGLRGEPPFDGAHFPRLPWGGTPVAPEDVQFIADWIDDGCRADDHVLAGFDLEADPDVLPLGFSLAVIEPARAEPAAREAFEVYGGSPNEYRYRHGEVKQRMNLDCMSPDQIEKLRAAFRELYALNKWPEDRRNYNNLALIHQNHCQHGWERFLPWHRIYLYEFEQALQDVVPDVTMPYWDWTMQRYCPSTPEKGDVIPASFKAFLTDQSLHYLRRADPALPADEAKALEPLVGQLYTSQQTFFAAVAARVDAKYTQGDYRRRFVDALLAANALWYPLRYPAEYQQNGKPSTINQTIHYHYPTADDMEQILALRSFRDFGGGSLYNDSFGFLDQNPHNTMHIWTGGMNPNFGQTDDPVTDKKDFFRDLRGDRNRGVRVAGRRFHSREDLYSQPQFGDMFSNLTASYDPVFWPIHANIDRVWAEWQQMHPSALPADLDSVLTPWSYTIADTLDMSRFGYEYVKSTFLIPVGIEAPVGRFVSRPIDVPDAVRAAFRQAEVRLHRVPQLPRSCFIRVFLNLPDAGAATPIDHPNYAGYLAVFGHGPCYGGPGHCDVPERRPRPFDVRPRSHNTPRNHRVNVTKTARRLIEAGATTLQITLVVVGVDYCEDNELLRLEGVSLNFLD